MERFTHYYKGKVADPYNDPQMRDMVRKLAEYEDAEEAGLLVRLPYALGTECYYANLALHEVCPAEITGFEINKYTNPSLWINFEYVSKWVGRHTHKEREDLTLGKLLFSTAEEAEQALKEARKR